MKPTNNPNSPQGPNQGALLESLHRVKGYSPEQLMAVKATGDSMEPLIHDGDYVTLRPCEADPATLAYGRVHLVETDRGAFLRIIKPDPDNSEALLLESVNEAFAPFSVPFNEVRRLFRALATITHFNQQQP